MDKKKATARVVAALMNAKRLEDLPEYLPRLLGHFAGITDDPNGERVYPGMDSDTLFSRLMGASYEVHNPDNPDDNNAEVGTFQAEIEGEMLTVPVRTLPDTTVFQWVDEGGTGKMFVVVKDAIRPKSSITVVRLAKCKGVEIVSSITPGRLVFPSTIDKVSGFVHGADVSKAQVLSAYLEVAGYPRPKR